MSRTILALFLLAAGIACADAPVRTDGDLEHWADETLSGAVARHQASGIAVAMLRDGKVLFSKGYGHADSEGKVAVDPDTTPFSIGSITKSFTATAVAQCSSAASSIPWMIRPTGICAEFNCPAPTAGMSRCAT